MKNRRTLSIFLAVLLLIGILGGCQFGADREESTRKADYSIGVSGDNAPYYSKEESGESGIYVSLLDAIAKEENFTYEFVKIDESSASQALQDGIIDGFLGSLVGETGEVELVDSKAFYTSNVCVVSPKNGGIKKLNALDGKEISVKSATAEERFGEYLAVKYGGEAVAFAASADVLSDINSGYSQAAVVDEQYYENHSGIFENWICVKVSEKYQNKHKLHTAKDNDLQKAFTEGLRKLEEENRLSEIVSVQKENQ